MSKNKEEILLSVTGISEKIANLILEKAKFWLNSGAIDTDDESLNAVISRAIIAVALEEIAQKYEALGSKGRAIEQNLRYF